MCYRWWVVRCARDVNAVRDGDGAFSRCANYFLPSSSCFLHLIRSAFVLACTSPYSHNLQVRFYSSSCCSLHRSPHIISSFSWCLHVFPIHDTFLAHSVVFSSQSTVTPLSSSVVFHCCFSCLIGMLSWSTVFRRHPQASTLHTLLVALPYVYYLVLRFLSFILGPHMC